jgi:hypothetical protein
VGRDKLTLREFLRLLPVGFLALFHARRMDAQTSGSFASAYKPYDVITTYIGAPPGSQVITLVTFARVCNFAANFANSVGSCGTNPTATATLTIAKNGSSVGSISISTGGVFTFTSSGGAPVQFGVGDILRVTAQTSADATLANVSVSLAGIRQGI